MKKGSVSSVTEALKKSQSGSHRVLLPILLETRTSGLNLTKVKLLRATQLIYIFLVDVVFVMSLVLGPLRRVFYVLRLQCFLRSAIS